MTQQALELLDIIYQIHRQRFRAKKIVEQLPDDVKKKHMGTVKDIEEVIHQNGHTIADIVLDIMQ